MKLQGMKALVTGAARGIGKGCALELARAGADVAINDLLRSEAAEATAAEIRALGRQAWIVEGDVFNRPSCEQVADGPVSCSCSTTIPSRSGAPRTPTCCSTT